MIEQWQELKETITEMRDNDGTGTQQDACKFLADYMEVLEKQMQEPCEDAVSREAVKNGMIKYGFHAPDMTVTEFVEDCLIPVTPRTNLAETSQDCISRAKALDTLKTSFLWMSFERYKKAKRMFEQLPSVTPQTITEFADKCRECGKIQNELYEDAVSRKRVIILIDEASEIHPYKVVGDSDTYSNYNQGWSDACDWLYANIDGIPSVTPERPNPDMIKRIRRNDT